VSAPRLLLVEDDAGMSHMLVAYLGRKNYQVTPVTDGERALRRLESGEAYDLVLTDIRMPGADGLAVLRAARAQETPPAVVLMTAYANVEDVLEAMEQGAYAYVRKPLMDLDRELGQILHRALEERRLALENEELMRKLKHATSVLAERQKRIRYDIEMAGHIQRSLLPDELVKINRCLVASRRFIGESLSGDFYDAIPLPEGAVGLVLGQALGRDLPAAILMASIAGHLRELARRYVEPHQVLTAANRAICGILERGYENFVSVFYGVVSGDRRKLDYACAAHPAPLQVRFSRPSEELPRPQGPFLGRFRDARFGMASAPLVKDDRLIVVTENVCQLENAHGTALSAERLGTWARELGAGSTSRAADELARRLKTWDADELAGQNALLMVVDML
jgi:sigma-B regulation protein RsbU (phosphoserine phosphatase)